CYWCVKVLSGLLDGIQPSGRLSPEELEFVGVYGNGSAPGPWQGADRLLDLWEQVEPHPIERTAEWGARSVPIREEAADEIAALMQQAP
ncbi:MAG: hypothetical protein ACRDQ2_08750, partial [Gaiellales bacterium]